MWTILGICLSRTICDLLIYLTEFYGELLLLGLSRIEIFLYERDREKGRKLGSRLRVYDQLPKLYTRLILPVHPFILFTRTLKSHRNWDLLLLLKTLLFIFLIC